MDPSLVTWQSAVYEPPEDGIMSDRNMLGEMLNVLMKDFSVFKCINCAWFGTVKQ
jgi:hypothetical protein